MQSYCAGQLRCCVLARRSLYFRVLSRASLRGASHLALLATLIIGPPTSSEGSDALQGAE